MLKPTEMKAAAFLAATLWIWTSGCATTRYMGRLDFPSERPSPTPSGRASVPAKDDYPATLPKIVAATPTDVVLECPGGGRQLLPRNSTYVQVDTSYGMGALEGFLGGAAIGLAAGAVGSTGCSSDACSGAAIGLSALVSGAFGALYGVWVGQKTTYVFAPWPP